MVLLKEKLDEDTTTTICSIDNSYNRSTSSSALLFSSGQQAVVAAADSALDFVMTASQKVQYHHHHHSLDGDGDDGDNNFVLPLEVQLALLEDTVFGWTHVTSEVIGHTLLPSLSYWIVTEMTRYILCLLFLSYDEKERIKTMMNMLTTNTTPETTEFGSSVQFSKEYNLICTIAQAFGVMAAIGTFRFIRQRRRVWLRSAYGSKDYQKDRVRRRQCVQEADRTNILGKLMSRIQRKRRLRTLQRAKNQFAKKHRSRISGSSVGSFSDTPDQKNGNSCDKTHTGGLFQRSIASPSKPDSLRTRTVASYTSAATTGDNDNEYDADYAASPSSSPTMAAKTEDGWTSPAVSPSSSFSSTDNLLITNRISEEETVSSESAYYRDLRRQLQHTSITQDHVAIPRIHHMAYAHGGYFGAAPFVLASPRWVRILRKLLPDVYVEISRRVLFSPASKLIHWAENNPVVAAYGVVQFLKEHQNDSEQESSDDGCTDDGLPMKIPCRTLPSIEWDIFLDPRLVRRVQVVLDAKDQYLQRQQPQDRENDVPAATSDEKVLQYLERELSKRAQELTDHLLIAHGNAWQLLLEQTGILKGVNYSRVSRTRRTLGGGMYARQWMAVFAEALRLGYKDDDGYDGNATMEDANWLMNDEDGDDDDAFSEYLDCSLDTTIAGALDLIHRILGTERPVGLVLDLKSRHVPNRILGVVVDTLRSAGISVEGIASFQVSEIRGVCKGIHDNRTKEIIFVHSAGDLQFACDQGLVQPGDHVFFNAGSLIWETTRPSVLRTLCKCALSLGFDGFDPRSIQAGYRIHGFGFSNMNSFDHSDEVIRRSIDGKPNSVARRLRTLHDYKHQYKFSMGVYVQEFAIDDAAATLLINHVNEHSELFNLGFAWGGVNGMSVHGIQPGRFTSTEGYWNQRHVGRQWKERA
jgi:hypothetical protein